MSPFGIPSQHDQTIWLAPKAEVFVEIESAPVAFLGVHHGEFNTTAIQPAERIVHESRPKPAALTIGIDGETLQVAAVAGAAGDRITEGVAALERDPIATGWCGAARFSQRVRIELPEGFEGASVDVEHHATMPRTARSQGSA